MYGTMDDASKPKLGKSLDTFGDASLGAVSGTESVSDWAPAPRNMDRASKT